MLENRKNAAEVQRHQKKQERLCKETLEGLKDLGSDMGPLFSRNCWRPLSMTRSNT